MGSSNLPKVSVIGGKKVSVFSINCVQMWCCVRMCNMTFIIIMDITDMTWCSKILIMNFPV